MSTLAELIARRDEYRLAESKALKSQEYQIGSAGHARRNRMADLEQIRKQIDLLDAQIAPLQQAAAGVRRVRYFRTC
jgi:septal ring factor EnvC (AmiA/AmiB activator)